MVFLNVKEIQKGAELIIIPIATARYVLVEERVGHEVGNRGIGTDIGTPLVALDSVMYPSIVLHLSPGDRNIRTTLIFVTIQNAGATVLDPIFRRSAFQESRHRSPAFSLIHKEKPIPIKPCTSFLHRNCL